jgi:hypothetical protein
VGNTHGLTDLFSWNVGLSLLDSGECKLRHASLLLRFQAELFLHDFYNLVGSIVNFRLDVVLVPDKNGALKLE